MNLSVLPKDLPKPIDDGACNHLKNKQIEDISLPNQDGNLLKLNRSDTFRLVIYCYPMTGHPERSLPENWDSIPGARGCTLETCSFRDAHDDFISLSAVPIGLSTQSVSDIKEVTTRLLVPYDVVSDEYLTFVNKLNLPRQGMIAIAHSPFSLTVGRLPLCAYDLYQSNSPPKTILPLSDCEI